MSEQNWFVRCGDIWIRADTITAVEVNYWGSEAYVVKVRSTALGAARVTGDHHPDKATAETAAEILMAALTGRSVSDD